MNNRGSGILLPIASLPSDYGIGSFGKEAYDFVDFLAEASQTYWQILPLSPTGYGDSPYSSCSAFAGNPYFISVELLYEEGLLDKKTLLLAKTNNERVDYESLFKNRIPLLKRAFLNFDQNNKDFLEYKQSGEAYEYSIYMALKELHNYSAWTNWEQKYQNPTRQVLAEFESYYCANIDFWTFTQFMFSRQWQALRRYAESKNIRIIGDIPIYVAYDSADVWMHGENFQLKSDRKPKKVAGVPPDMFSATGQLWGNPLYDWNNMKSDGYAWWKKRIEYSLNLYSLVRIDHFRGFDRYYAIPYGKPDARVGQWQKAPSWDLFSRLDCSKIIAEDLGTLDDGVYKLLKKTGCPGMKILEFSFDGGETNPYLPSNYSENFIAYTGTHDNEPLAPFVEARLKNNAEGFLHTINCELKAHKLAPATKADSVPVLCRRLIELLSKSKARIVIFPIQDLLCLDSDSRINFPSTLSLDNWSWRLKKGQAKKAIPMLKKFTLKYNR